MPTLIVVNNVKEWPFHLPDVEVVDARGYLTRPEFGEMRTAKVFNLCRSYRYQSTGYYVTLLATARGHRPLPSVTTIQDMKSQSAVRFVSDDIERLIQESLAPIQSDEFTLSIYFGKNLAKRYNALALRLFNLFQAPLLRAQFSRNHKWQLRSIGPIPVGEIPEHHRQFVIEVASEYFAGRRASPRRHVPAKYDLAILLNPQEECAPSDPKALERFTRVAERRGFRVEQIGRDDYARLAEFDALWIRETTQVNHHTYRFARRAELEGLVVIDDPESIVKCSNKVYLAQLLHRHRVPIPRTVIVHRDNLERVGSELGFPCVLKQPDAAFSRGVVKVDSAEEFVRQAAEFLERSDLLVAQEFVPTEFDWRIGILDGRPLFACKYHMVPRHWQITKTEGEGRRRYGRTETVPIELAPRHVVRSALKAANLIGRGLYGVDVKQNHKQCWVIEVNDNPNLDAGVEDQLLKQDLYERLVDVFQARLEARKAGRVAS